MVADVRGDPDVGSGVATCSGNGCSNLASGYPKRRLDAAAPADTDM